jgi:hypothetical protein
MGQDATACTGEEFEGVHGRILLGFDRGQGIELGSPPGLHQGNVRSWRVAIIIPFMLHNASGRTEFHGRLIATAVDGKYKRLPCLGSINITANAVVETASSFHQFLACIKIGYTRRRCSPPSGQRRHGCILLPDALQGLFRCPFQDPLKYLLNAILRGEYVISPHFVDKGDVVEYMLGPSRAVGYSVL